MPVDAKGIFVCKANFKEDNRPKSLCVCVCVCVCSVYVCVCVQLSIASTVTASDMIIHHVLIILALIFIQGHTDFILNIQLFQKVFKQCPSCFAVIYYIYNVKIVQLKVYIICSLSNDFDLRSRSQLHLKVGKCFNLYFNTLIVISL